MPYNDSEQTRIKKIDSSIAFYSLSYAFTDNLNLELNYRQRSGFYLDGSSKTTNNSKIYKLQNLNIAQYSITGTYSFESGHKSFLIDPILYERRKDSSAWLLISKINRINFSSLESLSILPNLISNSDIATAEAYTLETTMAYSKNIFWDHWFLGFGYGLGLTVNNVKTKNLLGSERNATKIGTSSLGIVAFGYTWTALQTGLYANVQNALLKVENYEFGNVSGTAGYYIGYQF